MSRLIKNELIKIFHKKSLYIMLIIILVFMIASCVLTKIFENSADRYIDENIEFFEEELKEIDRNDPENEDYYESIQNEIKILKLQKQYGTDSWQTYVINDQGREILDNMVYSEGTEEYEKYKKQFDVFLSRLELGDWKSFVQEELDDVNTQIEELKTLNLTNKSLEYNKQVLEWRLEKDIPYGYSNTNTYLETWLNGKMQIDEYEETVNTQNKTYEEKREYQKAIGLVNLSEYAIINNIDSNIGLNTSYADETSNLSTEADYELLNVFDNYSIFIIVAIVIIAGTIVSEEFNKGTIKLLLVKPYKRTKILFAKFISCLIILAIVFVSVVLMQTVIGGITYGFGDYNGSIIIYNFNTNSIQTIGIIPYLLQILVEKLPMYLLIMTLAFALSTIFTNSPIAIALPILGMFGAEIINELAYTYEKAKFLKYFVTPNWDLSVFEFGKLPQFEPISLPFSIIICIIYFVIMMVASIVAFKKRDIKNI